MKRPKEEDAENPFASAPSPGCSYRGSIVSPGPLAWCFLVPCVAEERWFGSVSSAGGRWMNRDPFSLAGLIEMVALAGMEPAAAKWHRFFASPRHEETPFGTELAGAPRERVQARGSSVIYFIRCQDDGPIKIGIAANAQERLDALQLANPYPLRLIGTMPGGSAPLDEERKIHLRFADYRIRGEWFEPCEELLEFIRAGIVKPRPAPRIIEVADGRIVHVPREA